MYKNKFKKFGGEWIPDIIQYIKEYIEDRPEITISVGCDSIQKRRKTVYAMTIMMYSHDIRNGAHVVFFREAIPKEKNTFVRLQREAEYAHSIAEYLDDELKGFYTRQDLSKVQRQKYKYHILRCEGQYPNIELHNQEAFVDNLILTSYEAEQDYKLVDIHLDFNPEPGDGKNRSNPSYLSFAPGLRGMGYRVFAKPLAHASTSAADLLLK